MGSIFSTRKKKELYKNLPSPSPKPTSFSSQLLAFVKILMMLSFKLTCLYFLKFASYLFLCVLGKFRWFSHFLVIGQNTQYPQLKGGEIYCRSQFRSFSSWLASSNTDMVLQQSLGKGKLLMSQRSGSRERKRKQEGG